MAFYSLEKRYTTWVQKIQVPQNAQKNSAMMDDQD